MAYVDGCVLAVPTANKEQYITAASKMAAIFKKNGALHVSENWGNEVPEGEVTSFPMAVKCQADETVVFSWIVWPSKEVRDEGMKNSMEDPGIEPDTFTKIFDGKRMIFGGFEPIVEA